MDDRTRLRDLAISDSGFLFDPSSGLTFTLNGTAQLILRRLRDGVPPGAIEAALQEEFDCGDGDDPGADVSELLRQLREHGLLAPAAPGSREVGHAPA